MCALSWSITKTVLRNAVSKTSKKCFPVVFRPDFCKPHYRSIDRYSNLQPNSTEAAVSSVSPITSSLVNIIPRLQCPVD